MKKGTLSSVNNSVEFVLSRKEIKNHERKSYFTHRFKSQFFILK